MLRLLAIPVVLVGLMTSACQTSMLKQFNKVKLGMEKDDVLDAMGSPSRTQRFHGKDRWTYVFYEDRVRFEKEVQFFEGNAIYVGDVSQPPAEVAAATIDQKNELRNKEIDAEIARDVEKHRKAYENYESEVRGENGVQYVPQFEPIR